MKGKSPLLHVLVVLLAAGSGRTEEVSYLYVSSHHTDSVVRYDAATGEYVDTFIPSGHGGLEEPEAMAFGPDGNLYVASANLHRIKRYDGVTGAYIDDFARGGRLQYPRGIAFGPDGHLYVCSSHSYNVLRYDGQTGAFLDRFITREEGGFGKVQDLIFHEDGCLYVSSREGPEDVRKFDATTGEFLGVFASGGGLTETQGMAFGPDGNLYVASSGSHEVIRYDGTTGAFIDVFVSSRSGGLGNTEDVGFGPYGDLYVTSFYSDNVLRYHGRTGEFAEVLAAGDGLNHPTYLLLDPGVVQPVIFGDADGDGRVDDDDLSIVLANWTGVGGEGKTWGQGDFDQNGAVTDSDLSFLLANWSGGTDSVGMPEPGSLAVLAAGGVALLWRRRLDGSAAGRRGPWAS